MAHIVVGIRSGQPEIAGYSCHRRPAAIVEIDRRLAGGFRRDALAAAAGMRLRDQRRRFVVLRFATGLAGCNLVLDRELLPAELLLDRIGIRNHTPVVDRSGRTRRDAVETEIALGRVDDIIVVVMRDRIDRAGLLAGVAANADLGIDEMLLVRGCGCGCVHWIARGTTRRSIPPLQGRVDRLSERSERRRSGWGHFLVRTKPHPARRFASRHPPPQAGEG